jgi:hypothetical protein
LLPPAAAAVVVARPLRKPLLQRSPVLLGRNKTLIMSHKNNSHNNEAKKLAPSLALGDQNPSIGLSRRPLDTAATTTTAAADDAAAAAATRRKHLRANFKSTKSGLKRVEPPVCKFFQQRGMCFDEQCPYRHIKLGRQQRLGGSL